MVTLGIEKFAAAPPPALRGCRLGLLCNQASVDSRLTHARRLVEEALPGALACLFSPQHGLYAEKQDNMIESGHGRDGGLPVFSLYGDTRRPTAEMLGGIDVLLVDLVDVGTRVYTFMSTLSHCLEECGRRGKKVVVLDRPNPVGGEAVEGNILDERCRSFVGLHPLPMRHGLTFGELALYINHRLDTPAELDVIAMDGWRRHMLFPDTGLPWVYPSPNLPTFASALVYPGQVVWEGTNVSEGRGTTLPFELFGAPWLDPDAVLAGVDAGLLDGCFLRPVCFEPTSNKWAGRTCRGFHLHVTDAARFRPYRASLALLRAVMRAHSEFALKEPPYEYEYHKTPLDLILGDGGLRRALADGAAVQDLEGGWLPALRRFDHERRRFFLYQ